LYADVQGVPQGRRRADELLERLGATSYADTPCGELSTGMKRRVVLARALVHAPQVLLLDEPTDGLDVLGRRHAHADDVGAPGHLGGGCGAACPERHGGVHRRVVRVIAPKGRQRHAQAQRPAPRHPHRHPRHAGSPSSVDPRRPRHRIMSRACPTAPTGALGELS
ncbi:MAG: ATP-binding cassette domain-containing protein, partial [Myxococcales bacterium]|nr:ATP-binding cassette domain-containing protein [Myxococcales bacterium]